MFHLRLVLGVSVSLLGINNAESDSSSGGLDTVNISLEKIMGMVMEWNLKTRRISPVHGQVFDTVSARTART